VKYVISWRERPAASSRDYEAAHERVLEVFKHGDFKFPKSFSIQQFVIRVGTYGGYMIVETDQPTTSTISRASLQYSNSRWSR
jgi:hypothetical protein